MSRRASEKKWRAGVLGATGMVGQRLVRLLAEHPWFELTAVAASERSLGKRYPEAARWHLEGAVPEAARELVLEDLEPDLDCDFVFSALDSSVAGEAEERFARAGYPVVTGFIGATEDGRITTLGRNSSDFSGALVAHVVEAEELVIWTDVDGIYTVNPHDSEEAKLFDELSYDEAHALAASGAKVLHPNVLPLAAQTEMAVWVRNTFKPETRGTRIGSQQNGGVA